ncbi:MAG: carbonic anhydrase [Caldilineaceae bacterium]
MIPTFSPIFAKQQAPDYLWIGCSDSRVPANQIVDLLPGEIFVHRNIANMVVHSDLNCLSVISCRGGLRGQPHYCLWPLWLWRHSAALEEQDHGLIDNWLRHIKDVYRVHQAELDRASTEEEKRPPLRIEHHRTGFQCLQYNNCAECLASGQDAFGPWLGLSD